ncbi:protein that induces appearance of [Moniliophthora roreri MCA 2997]|uniref:Protein that induces appearance of n=2 Tax=Moniliophthora roreri TaxID=221103 RepID=V2XJP0_MONRO|nr:protein that induces appearance of [Moniliophthora roreri MCA 2997]KAI3604393.1 protein that induces appearance of [Moniliophthora roreri]
MVFANLPHHEKDAFFSLLDEYFQSRPELVARLQGGQGSDSRTTVTLPSATEIQSAASRVASYARNAASSGPPPKHEPNPHTPVAMPKGLVSAQKLGDVDTSSKSRMLSSSLLGKFQQQPQVHAPIPPPAFTAKKNTFAPPPTRAPVSAPEPEVNGEWAEALYDYDSSEPGDLQIRANQRVLVTERTSDDWWTGTFNGKSGLFPATYVKLL